MSERSDIAIVGAARRMAGGQSALCMTACAAFLVALGLALPADGSSSVPPTASKETSEMAHLQGTWDVVEIAYAELPDHAIVTIEIAPGEMQGKAACSYYRAPLAIEGDRLNKGEIERSGHECDMELEEAEANFMRVLEIVDRFEIDAEGGLTLLAQTSPMIRAIPRAPE